MDREKHPTSTEEKLHQCDLEWNSHGNASLYRMQFQLTGEGGEYIMGDSAIILHQNKHMC